MTTAHERSFDFPTDTNIIWVRMLNVNTPQIINTLKIHKWKYKIKKIWDEVDLTWCRFIRWDNCRFGSCCCYAGRRIVWIIFSLSAIQSGWCWVPSIISHYDCLRFLDLLLICVSPPNLAHSIVCSFYLY